MARVGKFVLPLVAFLIFAAGLTALLIWNDTAREVAHDTLQLLFAVFSTPFIFEATFAVLFLCALLLYNRWRLHKEGDGWVYLMTQEPDEEGASPLVAQPRDSVVLQNKPETIDEAQTETGIIEGYLELGMAAQAQQELDHDPTRHEKLEGARLQIRVLAANLDTENAINTIRETASGISGARLVLAEVALENARWILKHLHREDVAKLWLDEAQSLDPSSFDRVGPQEAIRKLL